MNSSDIYQISNQLKFSHKTKIKRHNQQHWEGTVPVIITASRRPNLANWSAASPPILTEPQ